MSLLVDSLKDRLLLAIPKKGRLHEKCVELLSGESDLLIGAAGSARAALDADSRLRSNSVLIQTGIPD